MKVYLENSIFFFHKAHPPPAKGKRKATPPLFLLAPRPNPEWNGSPPAACAPARGRGAPAPPFPQRHSPPPPAPAPCDPHPPPPAPRPDVRHTVLAGEGSGQLACRPSPRLTCVLRPAFTLRPAPPRRLVISRCASGDILSLGAQSDMKIKPNSAPCPAK